MTEVYKLLGYLPHVRRKRVAHARRACTVAVRIRCERAGVTGTLTNLKGKVG